MKSANVQLPFCVDILHMLLPSRQLTHVQPPPDETQKRLMYPKHCLINIWGLHLQNV
jgi:hypothetical protein